MKILKENFGFTQVESHQFFEELNNAKRYKIFILQTQEREPAFCKRKDGTIKVISDGISIDSGDSEMTMRKGSFFIDMTRPTSKIYKYQSVDGWYCEIWI
jgi:hypothetical protein